MGRARVVPITPSVLDWAVRESSYPPTVVAQKTGVSLGTYHAWLRGESQPSWTQFRKLAARLKRTPATFLLPGPPAAGTPRIEFRRPPGTARDTLNPTERRIMRDARRLQDLLRWLQDELGEPRPRIPHLRTETDPEEAARSISATLPARDETAMRTPAQAFEWWRRALEERGVLVFTFSLGREGVRGFSIWEDRAPVVAVNTAWRVEARTFTLFHELGHLLTRTDSACLEAGRRFARPSDAIERWCEQFSAAVLLPRDDVRKFLTGELRRPASAKVEDLDVPSRLATRFKVSLRAATLRLIEMNLASWNLYADIPPVSDHKPSGGGGKGRERAEIREDQYGDRAMSLFVSALDRDVLGRTDVLDALAISDADLTKLERRVMSTT